MARTKKVFAKVAAPGISVVVLLGVLALPVAAEVQKDGSIEYRDVAPYVALLKRKVRAKTGRWRRSFEIPRTAQVEVFGRSVRPHWGSEYLRVRYHKRTGWVKERDLKKLGDITDRMKLDGLIRYFEIAARKAVVARSTKAKSSQWSRRFKVPRGATVEVDRKTAFAWWGSYYYRIRYRGKAGWLGERYLKLQDAVASPSAPAVAAEPEGTAEKGRPSATVPERQVAAPPLHSAKKPAAAAVQETGDAEDGVDFLKRVYFEVRGKLDPANWRVQHPLVGALGLAIWNRLDHASPDGEKFLEQAYSPIGGLGLARLNSLLEKLFEKSEPKKVARLTPLELVDRFLAAGLLELE